jgi:hypothetical protein
MAFILLPRNRARGLLLFGHDPPTDGTDNGRKLPHEKRLLR